MRCAMAVAQFGVKFWGTYRGDDGEPQSQWFCNVPRDRFVPGYEGAVEGNCVVCTKPGAIHFDKDILVPLWKTAMDTLPIVNKDTPKADKPLVSINKFDLKPALISDAGLQQACLRFSSSPEKCFDEFQLLIQQAEKQLHSLALKARAPSEKDMVDLAHLGHGQMALATALEIVSLREAEIAGCASLAAFLKDAISEHPGLDPLILSKLMRKCDIALAGPRESLEKLDGILPDVFVKRSFSESDLGLPGVGNIGKELGSRAALAMAADKVSTVLAKWIKDLKKLHVRETPSGEPQQKKQRKDKSLIQCHGCGRLGHFRSECPGRSAPATFSQTLPGFPPPPAR